MDATFMPIQKVNFEVKNIYEKSELIQEELFLDIWSNGSIVPKDSLLLASRFIIDLFSSFVKNEFSQELNVIKESEEGKSIVNTHTDVTIEELQLSIRSYNCLKRENINTVGDLLKYSPEKLQELKNFGKKSADEIFNTLKKSVW